MDKLTNKDKCTYVTIKWSSGYHDCEMDIDESI